MTKIDDSTSAVSAVLSTLFHANRENLNYPSPEDGAAKDVM